MGRLRQGFFVTDENVFEIINGSMYQVEFDGDGPLADLSPGYYNAELEPVPADEAVGKPSAERVRSKRE